MLRAMLMDAQTLTEKENVDRGFLDGHSTCKDLGVKSGGGQGRCVHSQGSVVYYFRNFVPYVFPILMSRRMHIGV